MTSGSEKEVVVDRDVVLVEKVVVKLREGLVDRLVGSFVGTAVLLSR